MSIMDFNMNNLGEFLRKNEERVNAMKVGSFLVDLSRNNMRFEFSNGNSVVLVSENDVFTDTRQFTVRVLKNGTTIDSAVCIEPEEVLPFLAKHRLNYAMLLTVMNCSYIPNEVKQNPIALVS